MSKFAPLVSTLNSYYGSSISNYSSYQATQSGSPTVGNGPNALIYNQQAVNLLASVGVGTQAFSCNITQHFFYCIFENVARHFDRPHWRVRQRG